MSSIWKACVRAIAWKLSLFGVFLKQNTIDTIRMPQNTDQKNSKYGHLFTLWVNTQFHIKTDTFPDFLLLKIHIFPVSIRNSHRGMNSCNKLSWNKVLLILLLAKYNSVSKNEVWNSRITKSSYASDVTLRVTNSKIFIEILLSTY